MIAAGAPHSDSAPGCLSGMRRIAIRHSCFPACQPPSMRSAPPVAVHFRPREKRRQKMASAPALIEKGPPPDAVGRVTILGWLGKKRRREPFIPGWSASRRRRRPFILGWYASRRRRKGAHPRKARQETSSAAIQLRKARQLTPSEASHSGMVCLPTPSEGIQFGRARAATSWHKTNYRTSGKFFPRKSFKACRPKRSRVKVARASSPAGSLGVPPSRASLRRSQSGNRKSEIQNLKLSGAEVALGLSTLNIQPLASSRELHQSKPP
jgi:hypothetical protein